MSISYARIHLAAESVSTAAFFTTPSTTQNASAINHQIKTTTIVLPRFLLFNMHTHISIIFNTYLGRLAKPMTRLSIYFDPLYIYSTFM